MLARLRRRPPSCSITRVWALRGSGAFAALREAGNGAAGPGWARAEPGARPLGPRGGPAREGAAEPRIQPRSRMGRGAGGALDLEDRFGGQPLIKTFCMKLKKLHSVSV